MNNQELYDLLDRFERSSLQTLKISREGFCVEMSRGGAPSAAPAPGAKAAPAPDAAAPSPAQPTAEGDVITAPMVGTFYAAPAPDQPPFVAVGDHVDKGQTVCLMEAMKMMSEVSAPCSCVITEVLKNSGDLAAFDEPLFRYRPC